MRIGINGGGHHTSLTTIGDQAASASAGGFDSYWLSQVFGPDAVTALGVIASRAPGIELGVAVVPIQSRPAVTLAMQALTVQAASGGRLVLGIGASHPQVAEHVYGTAYDRPVERVAAYLATLRRLLFEPSLVTVDASPPALLLAALGPRMLELAGRETDGTVTWMAGPKSLRHHIVPAVRDAADAAGKPAPRVVAGVLVSVTDDVSAARAAAAEQLAVYGTLPAYRASLQREGVDAPEDLVLSGNEATVADQLADLDDAGVTDIRVTEIAASPEDAERTRVLLQDLVRQ